MKRFNWIRSIKICFVLLTSYLLLEEFYTFFIVRPTLTSITKSRISPLDFPEILICPIPAFAEDRLVSVGYENSYKYAVGITEEEDHDKIITGWTGNQYQLNVKEVQEKVSIIQDVRDCPETRVDISVDGVLSKITLDMELSYNIYPKGICCKALRKTYAFGNCHCFKIIMRDNIKIDKVARSTISNIYPEEFLLIKASEVAAGLRNISLCKSLFLGHVTMPPYRHYFSEFILRGLRGLRATTEIKKSSSSSSHFLIGIPGLFIKKTLSRLMGFICSQMPPTEDTTLTD